MKGFLDALQSRGYLSVVEEKVSPDLEISSILSGLQENPILFKNISGSSLKLAGNLYSTKHLIETALGISDGRLLHELRESLANPAQTKGHVSSFDRTIWDYNEEADLTKLPVLKHFDREAGRYVTAGIVAAKFPNSNDENLSFHRMLILSKNKVAARIVPRHFHQIAKDSNGKVPLSVTIGPPPEVFVAASLQTQFGMSEYRIANKLASRGLELSESESTDVCVPVDSEIVLEGTVDFNELVDEAPFVDLTGTYDEIRKQPVITFHRMHYRRDSVYQAVVASTSEHAMFMGLPQELKIIDVLSKSIPKIRAINLTPASGGYFHCIASIEKSNDGDGKTAILSCFAASHPLKLVVVVDSDVDPFNAGQVEWALTTRFQAEKGVVVVNGAKGSSLDPSSGKLAVTSKLGLDATLPVKEDRTKYSRATITASPLAKSIVSSLTSNLRQRNPEP